MVNLCDQQHKMNDQNHDNQPREFAAQDEQLAEARVLYLPSRTTHLAYDPRGDIA